MLTIKVAGLEEYLEGGKNKIKVLIAGSPGSGKTRFSSFAPRPIYADCDGGLLSVADRRVPFGEVRSEEDMDAFLSLMEAECRKPPEQRRFDTVVIDTIDKYQKLVIHNYLRRKKRAEMEGWEDWGYLASRMQNLVARLFELDMNVLVLIHTKVKSIGKGDAQREFITLDLKGEMSESLPGEFDFVGLMENEFMLVDGGPQGGGMSQGIKRQIKWEPTPLVDWLKARGGGLKVTPVNFEDADFAAIRDGILAQLQNITAGEVLETLETRSIEEVTGPQQPLPPGPGGPVSTGTRPVAPPAAPPVPPAGPPATPPAAAPAPPTRPERPIAPAPAVAAPPPAAPRPEPPAPPEPEVSPEEAIANVEQVLGGKVIEDTANPQVSEAAEPEQLATTPVAEPSPAPSTEAAPAPAGEPFTPDGGTPTDGTFSVACGSPRFHDSAPDEGVGCGQLMTVTLAEGRVIEVAPEEGEPAQMAGLVDIGGIKYRAFLHNACFNKARTR